MPDEPQYVYAVGSQEDHFIVDRLYNQDQFVEAVAYCESRKSPKYTWLVMKVPLGGDWMQWRTVHKTPRGPKRVQS